MSEGVSSYKIRIFDKSKLLWTLILLDLFFITVHCFHYYGLLGNPMWSVEMDGGYAEFYQYGKELCILLILGGLYLKKRQFIFMAWSFLFLYFLMDDSLSIHENIGAHLADLLQLDSRLGLRKEDMGELILSLMAALFFFSIIGIAYKNADGSGKSFSGKLLFLVLILGFFGVVVDMFHVILPFWKGKMGVLEDGGELLSMSLIFAYVFRVYRAVEGRR
ncbi:hypothetical protein [Muriicola marianensis]|uniref:Uncharacterized protein n=1 Tax=Muriicola marianensis TaxID=1324801 RepID=A0ABQ1QQF8_9FLAO|nr:hypothetical protein [Muriicola marianensis]GGD40859.1 hypothetical protein GCM10011361_04990 [Muriicola marianensis]